MATANLTGAPELPADGQDVLFMRRCFDLAGRGAGCVSPNPMVGALLAHEGRIIGEGWHQRYGEAHAEVNAVAAVAEADRHLIPQSTLYCALEPCFHQGKTPPCVDLILREKIPAVVVANTDPNPLVAGQSLDKLRSAGVRVTAGILEAEGRYLNRAFFTWIADLRPYVILKWAQSADGYLGRPGARTPISGPMTQRLVHRWRKEADAIMVGTTTALVDDPRLDNRFYHGRPPLRIALDLAEKLPLSANLLDDSLPTWIIGPERTGTWKNTQFRHIDPGDLGAGWNHPAVAGHAQHPIFLPPHRMIAGVLQDLHAEQRAILLVEGGGRLLQQFLDTPYWDEIRQIEGPGRLGDGIPAPKVPGNAILQESFSVETDTIRIFTRHAYFSE